MRRIGNFLRLSTSDRQLLFNAVFLLITIRAGLYLLPFRVLLKLLKRANKLSEKSNDTQRASVNKITWTVNAVSRYTPGVKCLARALTTQVLMNRYGYSAELRIGVAKTEEGKLEAHAWIEYQGKVAIGNLPDLPRFIPLPSLEGVKL
jgi:Transglutaminase-like superfamily